MTHTITVTRCLDCPLYSPQDIDDCTPDMCLHEDSNWNRLDPFRGSASGEPLVFTKRDSLPSKCPLLQSPVTYRAERKGE